MLFLCLILLSGCSVSRIDDKSSEEVVDEILSLNIDLYNEVGKGYKYYAPRGMVRLDANDYNDVLKRNDVTYYLYVDVVSYYYKTKIEYESDDSYLFMELNFDDKTGYVLVTEEDDNLYVQMVYNYAKIEAYVSKDALNDALLDMCYVLSSIDFNDTLLTKMYEEGAFDSNEEVYRLFENKENEGNFLEYVEEYDKYDAPEQAVTPEEEIQVSETTTTTSSSATDADN